MGRGRPPLAPGQDKRSRTLGSCGGGLYGPIWVPTTEYTTPCARRALAMRAVQNSPLKVLLHAVLPREPDCHPPSGDTCHEFPFHPRGDVRTLGHMAGSCGPHAPAMNGALRMLRDSIGRTLPQPLHCEGSRASMSVFHYTRYLCRRTLSVCQPVIPVSQGRPDACQGSGSPHHLCVQPWSSLRPLGHPSSLSWFPRQPLTLPLGPRVPH